MTAALTWYGRQEQTNPFDPARTLVIRGISGLEYIRYACREKSLGNEIVVVLNVNGSQGGVPVTPAPDSWSLITFDTQPPAPRYFATPPIQWLIVSELTDTITPRPASPPGWPRFRLLTTVAGRDGFGLSTVSDSDSTGRALWIQLKNASVFVADTKLWRGETRWNPALKEKTDLLVLCNASPEMIFSIRNVLRPLYCVALPPGSCTDGACAGRGILSPISPEYAFTFRQSQLEKIMLATKDI